MLIASNGSATSINLFLVFACSLTLVLFARLEPLASHPLN
jgi:hypothetical protein